MPFTDDQPFLDAVFARYHDNGPRLVYADYLDDTGRPARADLIRVQLALAKLPADHQRRPELATREADLLLRHRAAWTTHLAEFVSGVAFRRGIADSVVVDAGVFLARGDELFRAAGENTIRRVRLLDTPRVLAKLVHAPILTRVRELDLCGNELGNGGVNLFVRSPHLSHLEALDLGFNGIDDAGVRLLARASTFPGLRELALNENGQITADGVRLLAESPFFAGLRVLDLSGNDVNEGGVKSLTQKTAMPELHTLRLAGNHIGDAGVAALTRSAVLGRMLARSPRLDLRANAIGPAGADALARCPQLDGVATLDLTKNYLGDRGLAALLASPHLARVRTLRLGQNQITDAGVLAARGVLAKRFAQLRVLDLSGNRLTRHGISVVFTECGSRKVDVSGNVQALTAGETPVPVGEVTDNVLDGVAELRRRVNHPQRLGGGE